MGEDNHHHEDETEDGCSDDPLLEGGKDDSNGGGAAAAAASVKAVVATDPQHQSNVHVYKRRWYILAVFALLSSFRTYVWGTLQPITYAVQVRWDLKNEKGNFFSS